MTPGNQIQRRLAEPDAVELVRRLIKDNPGMHRTALADRLCERFGFVDVRGRRQRSGCLKVLRWLEARGCFVLPAPQTRTGVGSPRRLAHAVPPPQEVPNVAGAICGLELVLVETDERRRIWNELLVREHPRGPGPLVGRQLRYLIGSEHGWLGGFAFASAALQLRDRDRWIGWDVETRRAYLQRVISLSRFLIRPSVRCQNLASRVLALVIQQLPKAFETRYGYRPWLLETFVDSTCFTGTCYQAANWIRIGATQGRGRQDRARCSGETVKDIYLYPLVDDFRERIGLPVHSGLGSLPLDAGLEAEQWAEQEFGGAPLGDRRLSRRLVKSARVQAENPASAFTGVGQGDWAMIKGHYRLIDQPDESAVNMENILEPHRQQTLRRMKAHKTVLCIQDGTDLDYDGLGECKGLGVVGTNQTEAQSHGLHLHSTLAVTEEGLPLGVLRTQCWAPQPRAEEEHRATSQIPIEEKETYCWLLGLQDCTAIAAEMPHTRIVGVMDRAADLFELFDQWRDNPRTELLVRAQYNRRTTEALKAFDSVKTTEPKLRVEIHIGRRSARLKRSKQKARVKEPARTAELALRYRQIELRPPPYHKDKQPVTLWIVHALEESAPASSRPVEWFLLTTMEIASPEQAERCLAWYCLRWRIEDWHRVLKSGCKIEDLGHKTAERLKRAIAIYAVIAWRIMLMTLLGRETPDLPAEVLFSDIELEVLRAYGAQRKLPSPTRLHDAVRLVAKMGGYIGRKNDPPPGHQLMWQGYTYLCILCAGYALRGP